MVKPKIGGRSRRRKSGELGNARFTSPLKLDQDTADVLMIHALQRRVSISILVADIVGGWLGLATDYDQAIFRDTLEPGRQAAAVPERWAGYLASLGFTANNEVANTVIPPTVPLDISIAPEVHVVPLRGLAPNEPGADPRPQKEDTPLSVQEVVSKEHSHPVRDDPAWKGVGYGNAAMEYELGYLQKEQE